MKKNKEVYKEVIGFQNYSISNLGNIISNNNYKRTKKRKLKPIQQMNGYLHFTLCKETKKYQFGAHRLVAIAFIDNPENKNYINHINGVKNDNRVENLEWVTSSENTLHAFKVGLMKSPKYYTNKTGKLHPNSKKLIVTTKKGDYVGIFYGTAEASRALNILAWTIAACCRGVRKHIQFNFKYI